MKQFKEWGLILIIILLPVMACTGKELNKGQVLNPKRTGASYQMKTHSLGRFTIEVPMDMKQVGRSHRLRLAEIQEIAWPQNSYKDEIRNKLWFDRISEIKKMRFPHGKGSTIIEQRDFGQLGQWAKGVFYYGNYALDKEGKWEILIDFGSTGIWLKSDSILIDKDNSDKMIRNLTNIARTYTAKLNDNHNKSILGDWFHLENGAFNLPYKWEESTYASFAGHPQNLKLEIEMSDTHMDEPKNEGLLARTAAAIVTGFASGVDIEKIRSHKRVLAGIKGEEQVVRMKDKDRTVLDFTWRFAGKKDSGEFPKIVITMESPDGNLDEKLRMWDAILDSFKPLYKSVH